jgi:hypothetical protein
MIRTCDQWFRKPLLYPLSYEGEEFILAVFAWQANGRDLNRTMPSVTVEYDNRDKRVQKTLPDSYATWQFNGRMFKAGRNPAVVYKQSQAG